MRVHTKVVLEWKDGKYQRIESECESFEYEGQVSYCKGGGETQTVQKSDPWEGVQTFLNGGLGIFPEAQKLYTNNDPQYFQGSTIADLSPETLQSQQMTGDIASQGSVGNNNLQNMYADTMGGGYLAGGQGFDRAFQAASNKILPQVDSSFARAGRFGGGLSQTAQTQALGDAFAGLYNDERSRQTQMAALSPQIDQMRYADANVLNSLGMQKEDYQQDLINAALAKHEFEQNLPYEKLNRYAQIIQPGLGVGGTNTTTMPAARSNRAAGAVGGAASGAMMGSYVMPGWGTAIGGVLGGLLGGFS